MNVPKQTIESHTPRTSVSTASNFHCKLEEIDDSTYSAMSTASHVFDPPLTSTTFVIFLTCNSLIRDTVISATESPLWEMWFENNPTRVRQFLSFVNTMLPTVEVCFTYEDSNGQDHEAPWHSASFDEVSIERWADYTKLFSENVGEVPMQGAAELFRNLRILEHELTSEEHDVVSIKSFAWRAKSFHPMWGILSWLAPSACKVETVEFDVLAMASSDHPNRRFQTLPLLMKDVPLSGWKTANELLPVEVDCWVLPGQGVTLAWTDIA